MTIYRRRYRDPKEHRWVNECAETRGRRILARGATLRRKEARDRDRSLRTQSGQVGHRAVFECARGRVRWASGKAFSEFLQSRQTCRHRCKLRLCKLLLLRIGRQFTCMDPLLLNAELVLGDDAVELVDKQSISAGHINALPREVGAVTLGAITAPMRLQIRRSRLANAPTQGQADGSMYIDWGPNQSCCLYHCVLTERRSCGLAVCLNSREFADFVIEVHGQPALLWQACVFPYRRRAQWNSERRLNAQLGWVERDPVMTLAVRIAGKLKRAAEVEIRLPRIAQRPPAIVALKIDKRFRSIASAVSGHDLARTRGSTAVAWCDS